MRDGVVTWLRGSAVILLAALGAPANAGPDPSCWFSAPSLPNGVRQWKPNTAVPVFVGNSANKGVTNAAYSPFDVYYAMNIALERWNEQSGTTLHLVNGAFTSNESEPGGIVINAGAKCSRFPASAGAVAGPDGFNLTGNIGLTNLLAGCFEGETYAKYYKDHPDTLVDLLVHELGHAMGRNDAYQFPNSCAPTACSTAHPTVMSCSGGGTVDVGSSGDLTDFDRTDHQQVYGYRMGLTTLRVRTLNGTTWGPMVNHGTGMYEVVPGPGSSFGKISIPVSIAQQTLWAVPRIWLREFFHSETFGADVAIPTAKAQRHPVSTSYAPTGTAIMAYVTETGKLTPARQVCYRTRTSAGVWSEEDCATPECTSISRNGAATAYDPLSGRFLLTHQCNSGGNDGILLRVVPAPGCANPLTCIKQSSFQYIRPAETAAIACSDDQSVGAPLNNCRLVYAKRDVAFQPIAWKLIGVGKDGSLRVDSKEYLTSIYTEHAPAVTWFNGAFRLATVRFGRYIDVYGSTSGSTTWGSGVRLNDVGWVSPPYFSPTTQCRWIYCTSKLSLFWLQYPDSR